MARKVIAIIIIIAAIGAAVWLAFYFLGKNAGRAEGNAVYVQPVSMLTASYNSSERFSGIVETQKTDKTEFDTERKLDELFVSVGDIVKEGDDLFSYDTESLNLEIDQLRLEIDKMNMNITSSNDEINALNASLEKAESQDKPEYLASIRQLQADIAQTEYDIKTKESEISRKEAAIAESVVRAKMGGIVESIADAQDIIDGKNYTEDGNTDNTFIVIRAEGDYRVKGKVDEQSIGRLYTGMEVIVRSRINDMTWKGYIAVIDTGSTESSDSSDSYMYYGDSGGDSVSRYAFYVELDSTKDILLGQHVIIEPDYGQQEARTGIWLNGGFLLQEDGNTYVWAAKDENSLLEKRAVTTGEHDSDTDEYQIVSGLSETDLIAWPDDKCKEGLPVTGEYTGDEGPDSTETNDMSDMADYFETDDFTDADGMTDADYINESDDMADTDDMTDTEYDNETDDYAKITETIEKE